MDDREAGAAARRAILRGDAEGLRAFYDGHFRPLYAFCYYRLARDHHAAEEVVQETMVAAIERIAEYDPARGDLHTWLAFLARNAIRRENQQRRRFAPVEAVAATAAGGDGGAPDRGRGEDGDAAAPAPAFADLDRAPLAGELLERRETAALVGVAMERLPSRYRAALTRKYLRGESLREIAAADATTEKAVESLLARAREAFKRAFLGTAANGFGFGD